MAIKDKEIYQNNDIRLEVVHIGDDTAFWIQAGIAGLQLTADELADLYELLHAYIEDFEGEDDDSE